MRHKNLINAIENKVKENSNWLYRIDHKGNTCYIFIITDDFDMLLIEIISKELYGASEIINTLKDADMLVGGETVPVMVQSIKINSCSLSVDYKNINVEIKNPSKNIFEINKNNWTSSIEDLNKVFSIEMVLNIIGNRKDFFK